MSNPFLQSIVLQNEWKQGQKNSQISHYRSNKLIDLNKSRLTMQDTYKHQNMITEGTDLQTSIIGNGLYNDGRNSIIHRSISSIPLAPEDQQLLKLQSSSPIKQKRYERPVSNYRSTALINSYPLYEQEIERPKYEKLSTNKSQLYRKSKRQEDPEMEKTFSGAFCWVLGLLGVVAAVIGVILGFGLLGGFEEFGGTSVAAPIPATGPVLNSVDKGAIAAPIPVIGNINPIDNQPTTAPIPVPGPVDNFIDPEPIAELLVDPINSRYFTWPVAVPQIFPEIVNYIDPQPIAEIIMPQASEVRAVVGQSQTLAQMTLPQTTPH